MVTYYRKVDIKIWTDARFRNLSPMPPSGQGLWIYLICGRETTNLPGVIVAGEAALAESLGWELEAFREAFREVFREGLAEADFKARLIWVPNAIKYHPPQSPNVVRSWSDKWELTPECDLKVKVYHELKAFVEGLGKGFAKAFQEAFGKASFNQGAGNREQGTGNREKTQSLIATPVPENEGDKIRHPVDWTPGTAIASTSDFADFVAQSGWGVTGVGSKDLNRIKPVIRAGPIEPSEIEMAVGRLGNAKPKRRVGDFISIIIGARVEAKQQAGDQEQCK